MAKHVGVELPRELHDALTTGRVMAVLGTFSERGAPYTTPVHILYPKGRESILLAQYKEHAAYHNMVWQKKVSLTFLEENNVAYTIIGRAGVVRAPAHRHPLMNIVRVDIIDIVSEESILFRVDAGVQWGYPGGEVEEVCQSLHEELRELSKTL